MTTTPRRRARLLAVGLLALTTTVCSDDDRDLAPTADGSARFGSQAVSMTVTDTPAGCAVDVAGSARAGVTSLVVTNGAARPRGVQVVRAVEGRRSEEVSGQLAPGGTPAPWLVPVGGVATVDPGGSARGDVELDPGRYWVLCTSEWGQVTMPAAPDPVADLVVDHVQANAARPSTTVEPDATVTATDHAFTSIGLRSGLQAVRFVNEGEHLHHAVLTPIAAGRDFGAGLDAVLGRGDPAAVDARRAVTIPAVGPGLAVTVDVDLGAGDYVLACLLPDRATSAPRHVERGMLAHVVVT